MSAGAWMGISLANEGDDEVIHIVQATGEIDEDGTFYGRAYCGADSEADRHYMTVYYGRIFGQSGCGPCMTAYSEEGK